MEQTGEGSSSNHTPESDIWLDTLSFKSQIFRELRNIRKLGWESSKGDEHFERQRRRADNASNRQCKFFFAMMQRIGDEMQNATASLEMTKQEPLVLDLCMAPGGYTASALKHNPTARVVAITLSEANGGHKILVRHGDKDPRVEVFVRDITMLTDEFGIENIPKEHPDLANFSRNARFLGEQSFDLIFCDGQVLRTHQRATYRENCEATRLLVSQLIIALRRIQSGGTIVILLHKIDSWGSANLTLTFSKFARVQLFKPQFNHAKRGSFYLVAKGVDPQMSQAQQALASWKSTWEKTTFGITDSLPQWPSAEDIENFVTQFGSEYIRLAEPIWETQLRALTKADFIKGQT